MAKGERRVEGTDGVVIQVEARKIYLRRQLLVSNIYSSTQSVSGAERASEDTIFQL